ncbi:hypothetical protein Q8F55_007440 [Vanrija albida]|uniref:Amino acid permease/ SLC12A domain-containing protein n=1 Tax=Vanrija albida TaxID=181172 RepID=A0ABR3PTT0_9TREE
MSTPEEKHHEAYTEGKEDAVKYYAEAVPAGTDNIELKRSLKARHLQMIALGGIIGPGYFVGLGNGFTNGGPAGLLLGFGIVGFLLWCVMQSLGEMAAFISVTGSFTNYTGRFLDPALAFAVGWIYYFLWICILATEYNNLGLVLTFWKSAMPGWGFILVFWVFFMCLVMLGVGTFGEVEFAITAVKLLFIVAFFLCSVLISSGAIGSQGPVGFKYYRDPGPFSNGVVGVFKVFVYAANLYAGSEMIGLTAGESVNPARDVPKAIKMVFWRIIIVFIGGIFFVSLCVPWNDPNYLSASSKTARSPFVIAFMRAGLPRGGDVVNAVIVITIISAINGSLYVSSRNLTAMAHEGKAPKWMGKTTKWGVPWVALLIGNLLGLLALLNLSSSAGHVYTWLVNISGVGVFITWSLICASHIRFRQALKLQGVSLDELPFKAPLYPFGAWFGLIGCIFFVFFQGWTVFMPPFEVESFFMNYLNIPVFVVLAAGFKIYNKTKWVDLRHADLQTGRRDWQRPTPGEKVPWGKRILSSIVG